MANVNAPFGLRPIGIAGGGEVREDVYGPYTIAAALNATLDYNSPVVLTGTGRNITAGAGTSEYLVGVFRGCEYYDSNGVYKRSRNWVAQTSTMSGKTIIAHVADDPATLFEVQGDNSSWVVSDIGLNVDYSVGTRNATTNTAGTVAVRTGINTTNTLMLRLVELSREITTNSYAAYARFIVQINAHRWRSDTGA